MDLKRVEKYSIYIGLLDMDSYEEIITVDKFRQILEEYCKNKKIAFSLSLLRGGYSHGKGYATENSLLIELIGIDHDSAERMALSLKKKVNTDSVMVTREYIESVIV